MSVKPNRPQRINRIAKKLAARFERQRHKTKIKGGRKKPFARHARKPKPRKMIAYDLETTNIALGTPELRYLTAYCAEWACSMRVETMEQFADVLAARFLIPEFKNARFVAWNANNFDVYFVARALLLKSEFILRPYLTRSKALRGLKVISATDEKMSWEFLDGLSMTGLGSTAVRSLKKFLETFAPAWGKMEAPNWEGGESFSADNPEHVKYAERDSEGLWRGLQAVEAITMEHFNTPLQPTVGNMGIKIFQANIPEELTIWEPGYDSMAAIRNQVMRGGFCFCARRYEGPIWKYDINQAYAAAMREALLPSGRCTHARKIHPYARTGIYRIRASNPRNETVPFYFTGMDGIKGFAFKEIPETWITTIELAQLQAEGWQIEVIEGFFWDEQFSMTEYVNRLETLRQTAPGGPNGAQGLIMKCIGNNSYGKTVEVLDGLELVMAAECPEGFHEYQDASGFNENLILDLATGEMVDASEPSYIWFKFGTPMLREYHQPQLGAFITAHVRMVVRRAALANAGSWLYADTDCIMLSAPAVAGSLAVHPSRYGAWKVEEEGADYWVIGKKVYARKSGGVSHAKGMNVKRLELTDFQQWFLGSSPKQTQLQRQNFVKVLSGSDMFSERTKVGEKSLARRD